MDGIFEVKKKKKSLVTEEIILFNAQLYVKSEDDVCVTTNTNTILLTGSIISEPHQLFLCSNRPLVISFCKLMNLHLTSHLISYKLFIYRAFTKCHTEQLKLKHMLSQFLTFFCTYTNQKVYFWWMDMKKTVFGP